MNAPPIIFSELLNDCFPPRDFSNHPPLQMELGSWSDIPGRTHREDALIAAGEQYPSQKPATLIVEEEFIQFVFHDLGYDHDDAAIRMLFRKVANESNTGNDMKPR